MDKFYDEKDEQKLKAEKKREANSLASMLSKKYNIPYTDLSIVPISIEALVMVSEDVARKADVAIFGVKGTTLEVAILTPNNQNLKGVLDSLKKRNYKINLHITSEYSLETAWERYKEILHTKKALAGTVEVSNTRLDELMKNIKSLKDLKMRVDAEINDVTILNASGLLEIIIAGALRTKASDIHIEPEEKTSRMRLRLDGVLQDVTTFSPDIYRLLSSRIKLTSGLKLNIKKLAQDGRFTIRAGNETIQIRTSILPGNFGEFVVLRILNPNTVALDIKRLGMDKKLLGIMMEAISKPNGMILNTGPTGSGKTTTLYSFLKLVNKPDIKIITIEDPIEYQLKGIAQTQVRKGYGFLEGLRSALRQDPDIIMIGEIRDRETARIAVNSALTGHLVFSTLHTNNAAGSIPRLIDLGVDIKVMSDSINLVMAQRLVRILCDSCKKEEKPSEGEKSLILNIVKTMPIDYKEIIPKVETASIWKPVGCPKCNNTGYDGRNGIFEAVEMDENVAKAVLEHPSEFDIWKASETQNILRMREHGVIKLLNGVTSMEELHRVVDLEGV